MNTIKIKTIHLSEPLFYELVEFLKNLYDPEGYGFSVTEEVHQEALGFVRRIKPELEEQGVLHNASI